MGTIQKASRTFTGAKCEGGYRLIHAAQLFMAWWAYRQGHLEFRDLRAYFALHEMVARRCVMERAVKPRYMLQELVKLTGGKGQDQATASIHRLERAGLVTWGSSHISFAESPSQSAGDAEAFAIQFGKIANRRRRIPVPRRTIRWLAKASRPVLVATVLGHLFRCVYAKGQLVAAEGSISASWVAEVFQVDPRNVKRARATLEAIKWLSEKESDHWHRQRHGKRVVVNLQWQEAPRGQRDIQLRTPPRTASSPTELPPPETNRKLLNGFNNQKPAAAGHAGFCSKQDSTPTLRHIQPADLEDPQRVSVLFKQAVQAGYLKDSVARRLEFFAAAARAKRLGSRNSCGFFATIVRRGLWRNISQIDEDAARRALANHPELIYTSGPASTHPASVRHRVDADDLCDRTMIRNLIRISLNSIGSPQRQCSIPSGDGFSRNLNPYTDSPLPPRGRRVFGGLEQCQGGAVGEEAPRTRGVVP